ncbi:MAG: hypothetical protein JWM75_1438 [Sphingomonas bacterium]|nr:hypothetical protein [Sphingomonas bacterium]
MDRERASGRNEAVDRLLAGAAGAADAARNRMDASAAALLAAPDCRLAEPTRIAVRDLLRAVAGVVEDDLRQRLIEGLGEGIPIVLGASLAAATVPIALPLLVQAGLLADRELVASLVRRVEEQRLADRLRAAQSAAGASLTDTWLQSGDEPLSAMTMALIVALSRREQRGADAPLTRTDLSADLQYRLVWRVAAALRHHVLATAAMPPAAADRALATAATALLAGYDESDTVQGRAMQIARRLHQRGRLDDALIARAAGEGLVAFLVAALAVRVRIEFASALEMVTDPEGSRLTILLRGAGVGRSVSAAILRAIGAALGTDDALIRVHAEAFDWLSPEAARDALAFSRCDPEYRAAAGAIAAHHADRRGA